jgi:hypothetical protein
VIQVPSRTLNETRGSGFFPTPFVIYRPMEVLFTGGIGDVIALESCWTEEERDSLTRIYWATRSAKPAKELFENSNRYRQVEHFVFPTPREVTYFNADGVRRDHPLPEGVQDWSILARFGDDRRPCLGSTFLNEPEGRPARCRPPARFCLPSGYVVVQHQTPLNDDSQRAERDLDGQEWDRILSRSENLDLYVVVLNSIDASPPPEHERVFNLVGQTTMAESLAILRGAEGYWGIASSLCVAASQLFEPDCLWVKGPETWLWLNRYTYFAPHTSFPFLFNSLTDTIPKETRLHKSMNRLMKMTCMRIFRSQLVGAGCVVEMTREEAEAFQRNGQAVPFVPPVPQLKTAESKKATATKKAARYES